MQQRFEEDKEDGHIEAYALFTQRLKDLWQHIRSLEGQLTPTHPIRMTIGQGGRLYNEIRLRYDSESSTTRLSCDFGDKRLPLIPFNAFVFNVILGLEKLKIRQKLDRAQLRFLYLLMQSGEKLVDVALKSAPPAFEKPLLVRFDPEERYATLHLFDHRWLKSEENRLAIWKRAVRELNELNGQRLRLHLLKEHSLEKLASLASKMQGTGFNMPYDLLIAYDASYRFEFKSERAEPHATSEAHEDLKAWRSGSQRKSRYFELTVAADAMSAHIAAVNLKALHSLRLQGGIDRAWLLHELAKLGIVHGTEAFETPLLKAIEKRQELAGLPVAAGTPPVPGETPFLYYFAGSEPDGDDKILDVRERQNYRLVKRGQLIAEPRYRAAQPAINVRGQKLHLRAPAAPEWQAGDGVRLSDEGCFYATRDGLFGESEGVLRCEEAYIHEGSVNLSSGNLFFDGTVVVRGDIEAGALVRVRGQLLVEGMITQASVQVKGDLDVRGGIITGPLAQVKVDGNLSCLFIEHSEVEVGGELAVKRSLLNSHVVVGGSLQMLDKKKSLISGGSISCGLVIRTALLGHPQGSSTECRIGADFVSAQRLKRARSRLERLLDLQRQLLSSLTPQDANEAHASAEAAARLRLEKAQRLIERIERRVAHCERHVRWNRSACLFVSRYLEKNVVLIAAGQRVPISSDLHAALVTGHAFQGRQLLDPNELGAYQAAHPEIDFTGLKKAG